MTAQRRNAVKQRVTRRSVQVRSSARPAPLAGEDPRRAAAPDRAPASPHRGREVPPTLGREILTSPHRGRDVPAGSVRDRPRTRAWSLAPALLLALGAAACSDGTEGLDGGLSTVDSTTGACSTDVDCPLDQHCRDGACAPGTGNACVADVDCPQAQRCEIVTGCGATRCHGNACVPIGTCTATTSCNGGNCLDGTCFPAATCAADGTCPDDLVCDRATNECRLPMTTTSTCTEDDDCEGEDVICAESACVPGVPCTTSAECAADQRCIQDYCRAPCTGDADCGSQRFRCDVPTGECQARCLGDGTCPQQQICEMNLCIPQQCTTTADCMAADQRCAGADRGHGRCEAFTPCDPANPMCPANTTCNGSGECEELPECVGDRGCGPTEFCDDGHCQPAVGCAAMTCPSGFDCVADRCVPGPCRGAGDCPVAGEICLAGVCTTPPAPSFVTEVRILTPAGVVRPGTTYAFVAVALDQAGEVVPGVSFTWASTATTVASIAAASTGSGVATGGARAGTTDITASVTVPGQGTITSAPVRLVNLGALAATTVRVTVVSQGTGTVVVGAPVEVFAGGVLAGRDTTDASGIAEVTGVDAAAPIDVTVADPGHDWVSVLGSTAHDLVITLPPVTRADRAGGLQGPIDLGSVQSTGALGYSVSGASFPSPLVGTDATALFGGELFRVPLPIGSQTIPVPSGSTVEFSFMGTPINLKDTFYARARSGLRAAWSFGGRLDLNLGGLGGGGTDILGQVLPYFQRFDHAVRPAFRVLEIPTAPDAQDVDGDGDSSELGPDWNRFPTIPLRPSVAQSLRYQMVVNNARLPLLADGNANAIVVMAGVLLPGVGFVPLGLDGLQDDMGSGLVPSFTTRIAPAHGGLEAGEYAVVALAIRITQGGLPGPGSARIATSSTLPTAIDFTDGWLDAPRTAELERTARRLTALPSAGAELVRMTARSPTGSWEVWVPAGGSGWSFPAVPQGETDRVASGTSFVLDAIDLAAGVDARALFDVARGGALGVDRATRGYARAPVSVR